MRKISDIKIDIPKAPKFIIESLKSQGFDAYIVGGCVRDAIIGKVANDYDITTNAKPEDIKKIFKRTIDTGIKHGTVSVLLYDNNVPYTYEVTTYRLDGEYEDGRHPKEVKFVDNLKEDLLRRDFTVNAMAYNDSVGLVDEFGGLVDIDKKIIRAVGNPVDRFTEDALRLLRAIRFAAKLGFEIEEDTKNAIPKLAENLSFVSKERVQVELTKTLTSDNPTYVDLVFKLGLAPFICKNFDKVLCGKFESNLSVHNAYTCLFYNTDVAIVNQMLRELKFDNNNMSKILSLLMAKKYYAELKKYYINKDYIAFDICVKELVNELKYELAFDFINILKINEKETDIIDYALERMNDFKENMTPIFVSDLSLNGKDMIDIGFVGEEIGVALSYLLKIVHKNSKYNEKNLLIETAKKAYNKYKGAAYEL